MLQRKPEHYFCLKRRPELHLLNVTLCEYQTSQPKIFSSWSGFQLPVCDYEPGHPSASQELLHSSQQFRLCSFVKQKDHQSVPSAFPNTLSRAGSCRQHEEGKGGGFPQESRTGPCPGSGSCWHCHHSTSPPGRSGKKQHPSHRLNFPQSPA